jgi:glycosyltransferase involved in cell wall biosynthesis
MSATVPSVSAILLCYNSENYIADALQSAFDQDCPPMQLILSDDASTDGTVKVVKDMLAAYRGSHSVEFHRCSNNSGSKSAHLSTAFPRATGDIIVSFDDDDISEPCRVRRIVDAFVTNPRAQAVFSAFSLIDETGPSAWGCKTTSPADWGACEHLLCPCRFLRGRNDASDPPRGSGKVRWPGPGHQRRYRPAFQGESARGCGLPRRESRPGPTARGKPDAKPRQLCIAGALPPACQIGR